MSQHTLSPYQQKEIDMASPQVLIIDDHNLGNICALVFKHGGISAEIVVDGRMALDRLKEVQPKMILLDLHMPGISGQVVLDKIRSDTRLSDTIVVLTTADLVLMQQLQEKADLVLPKPFKVEQLRELASRLALSSNVEIG
ncbi:MAG: response regulator [Chloroflexota bacterium]